MKKVAYDEYYKDDNYFGCPYEELVAFFESFDKNNQILDLGCGQGRDTLTLGRLGYKVIGVDHSCVGINQLNAVAEKEMLDVEGIVGDVYKYSIDSSVDVVLLDSMLHFYSIDKTKETEFVKRILKNIKVGGYFCDFIISGGTREKYLNALIADDEHPWEVIHEGYATYTDFNAIYHMLIVKKLTRL